jgi:hypothetical protein
MPQRIVDLFEAVEINEKESADGVRAGFSAANL